MKKIYFLIFLLLATFIISISNASAFEIKIAKTNYLPEETFQAEISGDFMEELAIDNIFFYKDEKEFPLAFYLFQISNEKYFVYVDLPTIAGNYSFAIKNILYKEEGKLKGESKKVNFVVRKSISSIYDEISKIDWQKHDIETISFALLALSYDKELSEEGKQILLGKSYENTCWPSICKVKETSLALLALSRVGYDTAKIEEWLADAQNNLDIGLWDLVLGGAADKQCQLSINGKKQIVNLSSTITLDLKNKGEQVNITINCSVDAKIVHTYKGKLHEFSMKKGATTSIILNNKKCFGQGYRNECDIESTALALFALKEIGKDIDSKALTWLANNAIKTKEKAIALYLGKSNIKEWLLNNQHVDGFWAEKALLETTQPDFEATVFALFALQKNGMIEKGKSWLLSQIDKQDIKNKALSTFVFPNSEIESIISIKPAIFKEKINTSITLKIKNKGLFPLNVSFLLLPFKTEKEVQLPKGKEKTIEFTIPSQLDKKEIKEIIVGSIDISYPAERTAKPVIMYNIPLIIMPLANKTISKTLELLPEHFRFAKKEIKVTLLEGEETLLRAILKNLSPKDINDIYLTYSKSLKIKSLEPEKIEKLEAGSSLVINFTILTKKACNGTIEAKSKEQNISTFLFLSVNVTRNESEINITTIPIEEDKTCADYNWTICEKDEKCDGSVVEIGGKICCTRKCIKKAGKGKIVGIIILLLVILIILFFLLRLRKPKKEKGIKEAMEKIEEKYKPETKIEKVRE